MKPSFETFTRTQDNLLYGDFPLITRSVTIGASQELKRGTVLGRKDRIDAIAVTNATDGTLTLSVAGEETEPLDHDATADAVQSALEALGIIEPGDVECSAGPLGTAAVLVRWRGRFAGVDPDLGADGSGLVGEGAAVAVTDSTNGTAGQYVAANAIGEDGSERPVAIVAEDVTTAADETAEVVACFAGHFNANALHADGFDDLGMLQNIFRPLGIHLSAAAPA